MGSMYSDYFGIKENAFSITPDPRFLFYSEQHCEALAHLLYGVMESGCFVMLTGEVGTGKTTVCRTMLEQMPENVDVALLLNPPNSGHELLLAINDELHIFLSHRDGSLHELVYTLTGRLLENHSHGRRTVVLIDEAQNISPDVLEQVRLLTNLETRAEKLLHVILVGQPELRELLMKPSLRQVAQRITARYHLEPLTADETRDYIYHRLSVAGCRHGVFSDAAIRQIYRESRGIPRVINILCDRALLGAFASDQPHVGSRQIRLAARQWRGEQRSHPFWLQRRFAVPTTAAGLLGAAALVAAYVGEWPGMQLVDAEQRLAASPPALVHPPLQGTFITNTDKVAAVVATTSMRTAERPTVAALPPAANEPPPVLKELEYIGPGSPPEAVRWLRRELDRIEGVTSADDSPQFDEQLKNRVESLQRSHGLVADGLAGPRTLNYVHTLYGKPFPQQVDSSPPTS